MAHEISGRYAIVDGARAYYDVCGSGIPLVCIHMGWACSLQWHYFMPIMAAAGFKVIAPDLPGHAKSMPVKLDALPQDARLRGMGMALH